jgi:predicted AAA+ superfamily ATPase
MQTSRTFIQHSQTKKAQLLENIVYLQRKRRQNQNPSEELYYWKSHDQEEVDLLERKTRSSWYR